jgi:hypothetical protein
LKSNKTPREKNLIGSLKHGGTFNMQTDTTAQMIISPLEVRGNAKLNMLKVIVNILGKRALGLEVAHLVSTVHDPLA